MRKPKIREVVEAVKALMFGPYTTKFPAVIEPPPDNLRAKAKYSEDDCVGCAACAEVCPAKAILVTDDVESKPPKRTLTLRYGHCIFCGQCELNCTTEKGVKLTQDYDTATFNLDEAVETVEKELVLCEVCGAIVGAKDHLLWIGRKIGAKRYANPALVHVEEEHLGLAGGEGARGKSPAVRRSDMMRVLCPKCRREVIVREAWGG